MPAKNTTVQLGEIDELLTEQEVALELGVSRGTLSVWRCTKRYPLPYVKVGRLVRYKRSGVNSFVSARTVGVFA